MSLSPERIAANETAIGFDNRDLLKEIEQLQGESRRNESVRVLDENLARVQKHLQHVVAERDRLEAELLHYREHRPARLVMPTFEECEADVCVDARERMLRPETA